MNTMSLTNFCRGGALLLGLALTSGAHGEILFTDTFTYPAGEGTISDGQLTAHNNGANISGGLWTTHSPTPTQTATTNVINVIAGQAEVKVAGAEDVSRSTNTIIPDGGSWYFALRLTVKDTRAEGDTSAIGTNYFTHLKDEGTSEFRARTYIKAANDTMNPEAFTFGISGSTLSSGGGAMVPWTAGDFTFDTPITLVVKYTSADGLPETPDDAFARLWVNPASEASTSIVDMTPSTTNLASDQMSRLALRQAGAGATQPNILVDVVSIGTTFSEVLAAVTPSTPLVDANFDDDLDVDGNDFLIWQRGLGTGTTNASGNTDGDTDVDATDLANWKAKFGLPVAVPVAAAVPEPGCAALAAIGLIACLGVKRRNR